jgi:small-conductance mechanosensitive channel
MRIAKLLGIFFAIILFSPAGLCSQEVRIAPDETADEIVVTEAATIETAIAEEIGAVPPFEESIESETIGLSLLIRLGIAAAIIVAQIFFMRFLWFLFRKLEAKAAEYGATKLKPLKIKKFNILDTKQMLSVIFFAIKVLKIAVTIILLYITIPAIFALFEPTRNLAQTLFGYILTPLKDILISFRDFIPDLFVIAVTLFLVRYILRSLKFFTKQIEKGKLVLPGFYADWAQPTFNILRGFVYAFTIAIIYPHIPGSGSATFQGISVFVGIIVSLGSTSAIGNLVAGIVLTYTRSFKIGDLIKLNDVTGFVVEKSGIVIRLRTTKNEYVTFPNMTVLTSNVTNYHTSLENNESLIIHAEITEGYSTPWKQVHEILIEAALKSEYIQKEPKPYVLQKTLDDFFCRYEINAYTKEVNKLSKVYSDLYQNIQDGYAAAGLDMTTPYFWSNGQ